MMVGALRRMKGCVAGKCDCRPHSENSWLTTHAVFIMYFGVLPMLPPCMSFIGVVVYDHLSYRAKPRGRHADEMRSTRWCIPKQTLSAGGGEEHGIPVGGDCVP